MRSGFGGAAWCCVDRRCKLASTSTAFDHATERRMPPIQMGRGNESQKELRVAGVSSGVGHAQRSAKMPAIIRPVALAANCIAGSALALVGFCAALGHELGQHAVKRAAIVKALLDQRDEVRHRLRRFILKQLDRDFTLGGGQLDSREVVGRCFGLS